MAVAAWTAYLCVHFVLVSAWFVRHYRRSPYALRWLPGTAMTLANQPTRCS